MIATELGWAIAAVAIAALSFWTGTVFQAGVIWEGVKSHRERLRTVEVKQHPLERSFHELRLDVAQGNLGVEDMNVEAEEYAPYVDEDEVIPPNDEGEGVEEDEGP